MTQTARLSDAQPVTEVKRLLGCEYDTIVQLIVHLAEMDGRDIHLAAVYPSLYTYCLGELQLSGYEAYNRIEVARAAKSFPRVFRMLGDRSLTLTTAQLLARRLTAENRDELLSGAVGRSKREVQELLARHFPRPGAVSILRKLPQPRAMFAPSGGDTPPSSLTTWPVRARTWRPPPFRPSPRPPPRGTAPSRRWRRTDTA